MEDMDPVVCTINNTKGIDCKDYGSSPEGTAPTLDTSNGAQNNIYFDSDLSEFDETAGTVKFVFT